MTQTEELKAEEYGERRRMQGCCMDCGRKYGDEHGFPDLIIPDEVWKQISPTHDEGGLLCPSCLCRRAFDAGIECQAEFHSGPFCIPTGYPRPVSGEGKQFPIQVGPYGRGFTIPWEAMAPFDIAEAMCVLNAESLREMEKYRDMTDEAFLEFVNKRLALLRHSGGSMEGVREVVGRVIKAYAESGLRPGRGARLSDAIKDLCSLLPPENTQSEP